LKKDKQKLEDGQKSLEGDVAKLQERCDALKKEKQKLEDEQKSLQGGVDALKVELEKLVAKQNGVSAKRRQEVAKHKYTMQQLKQQRKEHKKRNAQLQKDIDALIEKNWSAAKELNQKRVDRQQKAQEEEKEQETQPSPELGKSRAPPRRAAPPPPPPSTPPQDGDDGEDETQPSPELGKPRPPPKVPPRNDTARRLFESDQLDPNDYGNDQHQDYSSDDFQLVTRKRKRTGKGKKRVVARSPSPPPSSPSSPSHSSRRDVQGREGRTGSSSSVEILGEERAGPSSGTSSVRRNPGRGDARPYGRIRGSATRQNRPYLRSPHASDDDPDFTPNSTVPLVATSSHIGTPRHPVGNPHMHVQETQGDPMD